MKLLSGRGAQKTRNESMKLSMYSKQWLPGDTLRVFYPIFWSEDNKPELAVGAIWGHSVGDIKELGLKTAFIPSTTEFDANGQPIGQPDITYQFSLIAGAFVRGAKAAEEAVVMKKNWPTEALRKDALAKVEHKYDTKNNMNAVKPIIGRAQYYISTEVVSVKIVNNEPDMKSIEHTSCPLSNKVIEKLYQLMDDQKFAPSEGDEFFEVEWVYPVNTDKGQSARDASPNGLTPEYLLRNQKPSAYQAVTGKLMAVSRDADTIVRRATRMIDPAKVRAALTTYSIVHSSDIDWVDEEDTERLCKQAELIKSLGLRNSLTNDTVIKEIDAAFAELKASNEEALKTETVPEPVIPGVTQQDSLTNMPEPAAPVIPTPETQNVTPQLPPDPLAGIDQSKVEGAPSLDALLNGASNVGFSEAELAGIDTSLL